MKEEALHEKGGKGGKRGAFTSQMDIYLIMISSSNLKKHHISILHYCNKGVRSARKIHHETNIPLKTIYCNSNKLNQLN